LTAAGEVGGLRSYLYPVSLNVVGAVGATREVGQVELDLVPAGVQFHRQHAAERVHARRALVVARAEPAPDVLVVQDLHTYMNYYYHYHHQHYYSTRLTASFP